MVGYFSKQMENERSAFLIFVNFGNFYEVSREAIITRLIFSTIFNLVVLGIRFSSFG